MPRLDPLKDRINNLCQYCDFYPYLLSSLYLYLPVTLCTVALMFSPRSRTPKALFPFVFILEFVDGDRSWHYYRRYTRKDRNKKAEARSSCQFCSLPRILRTCYLPFLNSLRYLCFPDCWNFRYPRTIWCELTITSPIWFVLKYVTGTVLFWNCCFGSLSRPYVFGPVVKRWPFCFYCFPFSSRMNLTKRASCFLRYQS